MAPSACQASRGGELLRALSQTDIPPQAIFLLSGPEFPTPTLLAPCLTLPTPFPLLLQMNSQGHAGCWLRPKCGVLCVAASPSTCARPVCQSLQVLVELLSSPSSALLHTWLLVKQHCLSQPCFSKPPSPLFSPFRHSCPGPPLSHGHIKQYGLACLPLFLGPHGAWAEQDSKKSRGFESWTETDKTACICSIKPRPKAGSGGCFGGHHPPISQSPCTELGRSAGQLPYFPEATAPTPTRVGGLSLLKEQQQQQTMGPKGPRDGSSAC